MENFSQEEFEAELDKAAQEESRAFEFAHQNAVNAINVERLREVRVGAEQRLFPSEIRFLDRIQGKRICAPNIPGTFTAEYQMDYAAVMEKLFGSGYLRFSTLQEGVQFADMPTLRRLAKDKGLKAGGKKADIAQRVIDNYSDEELMGLGLPEVYILTTAGQRLLDRNSALILFYLNFSSDWITPEKIMEFQSQCPGEDGIDVLIRLLTVTMEEEISVFKKMPLCRQLQRLYQQKHDEKMVCQIEEMLQKMEPMWQAESEAKRAELLKRASAGLGISTAQLLKLEEDARCSLFGN